MTVLARTADGRAAAAAHVVQGATPTLFLAAAAMGDGDLGTSATLVMESATVLPAPHSRVPASIEAAGIRFTFEPREPWSRVDLAGVRWTATDAASGRQLGDSE